VNSVILIGGGGHAKQIIEIIKSCGDYHIVGITDNNPLKKKMLVGGVPVIGNDEVYKMLKEMGFELINVIHASALVSPSVTLGTGNAIMAGSIINAHTTLGSNCIINTGAIVEHDCIIHDHVHIATGAKLAGGVTIHEGSHIGLGALVKQEITIGRRTIVGAGALVLDDIPDKVVCGGIPAKVLKRLGDSILH
jgi:UDP-perosamine 4-acetyltransferase